MRRRFGVESTLAVLDLLLHRIGWIVRVLSRKATERDEAKIAAWKDERWPVISDVSSPQPKRRGQSASAGRPSPAMNLQTSPWPRTTSRISRTASAWIGFRSTTSASSGLAPTTAIKA